MTLILLRLRIERQFALARLGESFGVKTPFLRRNQQRSLSGVADDRPCFRDFPAWALSVSRCCTAPTLFSSSSMHPSFCLSQSGDPPSENLTPGFITGARHLDEFPCWPTRFAAPSSRSGSSVPVLSVQMTVVLPRVSTPESFLTRAFFRAIRLTAIASERVTVGRRPSGTLATIMPIAKIGCADQYSEA